MGSTLHFLATLTEWGLTLYEWIIIIAILVTWVNPDPRNPIVRFLGNMTQPLWNWLQEILPRPLALFSAYASLLVVWFLRIFVPGILRAMARYGAGALSIEALPGVAVGFFLLALGVVVQSVLFFLMVLLLIWFFLTLINPSINNPIVRTLYVLVDPFITPIQRRLPRQRIDISPLLAAGVFLLLNVLLVSPLVQMAVQLAHDGGVAAPLRTF